MQRCYDAPTFSNSPIQRCYDISSLRVLKQFYLPKTTNLVDLPNFGNVFIDEFAGVLQIIHREHSVESEALCPVHDGFLEVRQVFRIEFLFLSLVSELFPDDATRIVEGLWLHVEVVAQLFKCDIRDDVFGSNDEPGQPHDELEGRWSDFGYLLVRQMGAIDPLQKLFVDQRQILRFKIDGNRGRRLGCCG